MTLAKVQEWLSNLEVDEFIHLDGQVPDVRGSPSPVILNTMHVFTLRPEDPQFTENGICISSDDIEMGSPLENCTQMVTELPDAVSEVQNRAGFHYTWRKTSTTSHSENDISSMHFSPLDPLTERFDKFGLLDTPRQPKVANRRGGLRQVPRLQFDTEKSIPGCTPTGSRSFPLLNDGKSQSLMDFSDVDIPSLADESDLKSLRGSSSHSHMASFPKNADLNDVTIPSLSDESELKSLPESWTHPRRVTSPKHSDSNDVEIPYLSDESDLKSLPMWTSPGPIAHSPPENTETSDVEIPSLSGESGIKSLSESQIHSSSSKYILDQVLEAHSVDGRDSMYCASSATSGRTQSSYHNGSNVVETSMDLPDVEHSPYSIGHILGDPWFWGTAWEKLQMVGLGRPVDMSILDFHLLAEWLEKKNVSGTSFPFCYYVDMRTLDDPTASSNMMRRQFLLPMDLHLPMKPVFLLRDTGRPNGKRLLVFNYVERRVLILGGIENPSLDSNSSWKPLWTQVKELFGWSTEPVDVDQMIYADWIKGDLFFGQRVASFFQLAISGDWSWTTDGYGKPIAPNFSCDKFMLQQLFMNTLRRCNTYVQHWKALSEECKNNWKKAETRTEEEARIGFLNFKWVRHSATILHRYLDTCKTCTAHPFENGISANEMLKPENSNSEDTTSIDSASSEDQPHLSKVPSSKPIHTEEPGKEESYSPRWIFNKDDDDYLSAPIQSTVRRRDEQAGIWVFKDGVHILPDSLASWTDRGFRLPNSFFRTIQTDQPEKQIRTGTLLSTPESCRPSGWSEPNALHMSPRGMLDEAGTKAGTMESQRVFIRGKSRHKGSASHPSKYLAIDIEKDGINLPTEKIGISVDIDSLIHVTSPANFKVRSFDLYLSPPFANKQAFDKNNFVYVKVVNPPTDVQELQNPETRSVELMQLSRIPHLGLGHSGQGERRINFYVFFPRMIWMNEKRRRYATLLPNLLQELWFEEVVLPAYRNIFNHTPGFSEYQPQTLQEIRTRTGDRRQKEMNIVGQNSTRLMEDICRIVQENEVLSCFGSFFIVGDGRGMKLTTKQCVSPSSSQDSSSTPSFDFIKQQFPDLDWAQMQDRSKGELYLDVGIGYHSVDSQPLVGLWRIPILQEAFAQMGMQKGKVHHIGTHVAHGGLKAEMKVKGKQEHHIVSRLCYCLIFELVRKPGAIHYLCDDKEIINRSKVFLQATQNWLDLIGSAKSRSFGVRDEIRGLANTILSFLPSSVEEAQKFLKFRPILWIPTGTFLDMVERRLRELLYIHEKCWTDRIGNYRLMSLMLGHLLRYTFVTPRVKDVEINSAFQNLRFSEIIQRFGAFFLHGLNLTNMHIRDVPELDSVGLVNKYKIPFRRADSKGEPPVQLSLIQTARNQEYPWGSTLALSMVNDLLCSVPYQFIKPPSHLQSSSLMCPVSNKIFRVFTSNIWRLLSDHYVHFPEIPGTLEDAMSVWTVKSLIEETCKQDITFHPTYNGKVATSDKSLKTWESFLNRRPFFFPDRDSKDSPCTVFLDHDTLYLSMYYEFVDTHTKEESQHLDEDLEKIFGLLQCLPASRIKSGKDNVWVVTKGKLEFVVNASYLRCQAVTFEKSDRAPRANLNAETVKKINFEILYGDNTYKKKGKISQGLGNESRKPAWRPNKRTKKKKNQPMIKVKKIIIPSESDQEETSPNSSQSGSRSADSE